MGERVAVTVVVWVAILIALVWLAFVPLRGEDR
jgi:hypothetical protein